MIAFSCAYCGMKFSVKDEFAGRSTRCPTCKHALVVPALNATISHVPSGTPVGPASTLATAGLAVHRTLGGDATARDSTGSRSVDELLRRGASGKRFLIDHEIAHGGMGSILRAVDCDLRREIAVKYMLDPSDPGKAVRFVEEAQITGQLEHPNIVPIHELGLDAQKRLFFSMKMVRGRSLEQVLSAFRKDAREAEKSYSLTYLVTMLMGVCNALAYAHSRRVVHRDLKPANIMLGDFGEVYVMDWGLAKVLGESDALPHAAPASPPTNLSASGSYTSDKVSTSRDTTADLTQEGSILGTPLYMPPEQALGLLKEIDARSDIYSLGAILYEILTLHPPVDRSGGFTDILARVIEGEVVPPQERAPDRSRDGKVPAELSAIAMKALSVKKEGRYPTVEAFRRDLELYLEGRPVSAKHDTALEVVKKLARRNKGASVAAGVALVLLLVMAGYFLTINYQARVKAEDNYTAFLKEQEDRKKQGRESVPTYVTAAKLLIDRHDFKGAMQQARAALEFDPEHDEARFLRAQLLLIGQQFESAGEDLRAYLKQRPDDALARDLVDFLPKAKVGDIGTQLELATLFSQHQAHVFADGALEALGKNAAEARQKVLALYRERIDKAWPNQNLGRHLKMDGSGRFVMDIRNQPELTDLTPLSGIKLSSLLLNEWKELQDLTPLRGMPLTSLELRGCAKVRVLTPLVGMPLTVLDLTGTQVRDLTPLMDLPLQKLSLEGTPLKFSELKKLAGLKSLHSLNLYYTRVTNAGLKELAGLKTLRSLNVASSQITDDGLKELAELRSLQYLNIAGNQVTDKGLRELAGFTSLQSLNLNSCKFTDAGLKELAALMSIRVLDVSFTKMTDAGLKELAGLRSLQSLSLNSCPITDAGLRELASCNSLRSLYLDKTKVTDAGVVELQKALPGCKVIRDAK